MDEETATILFDNGYRTPEDIARASLAEVSSFVGITEDRALSLIHGALRYLANPPEQSYSAAEDAPAEEPLQAESPDDGSAEETFEEPEEDEVPEDEEQEDEEQMVAEADQEQLPSEADETPLEIRDLPSA